MAYIDPAEAEAEAWYRGQIAISDSYIEYMRRKVETMPSSADGDMARIRAEVLESKRLDDDLALEGQRLRFLVITAGGPDPLPSHPSRPRRRSFIGARKNLKIMEVV